MNLFELQENLKNFSQDQLVNEMRNPSGTAPQYLVLSELQRRRRIMQQEQAQMPQQEASVAEEAVAAAGMPQGGLAQMAQAMAPQTDVVQNTARMAEGGEIRRGPATAEERFQSELNARLADARDEYDPLMEALSDVPMYQDYEPGMGMDLELTGLANVGTALSRGLRRLRGEEPVGEMMGRSDELRRYIRALERQRDSLPPGVNSLTSPRDSGDIPRMAEGGVVRMQPGGLAGISADLRDFMIPSDRTSALLSNPSVVQQAEIMGMTPEEYAASLSRSRADALLAADIANQADIAEMADIAIPVDTAGSRGRAERRDVESDFSLSDIFGPIGGATDPRASRQREMYGEDEVAPAITPDITGVEDQTLTLTETETTPLGFSQELTATEEDLLPMTTELSFGSLEAQREGTSAPAVAGGVGGAAAPSGPSSDDLFEQDKWLALAQFGLGLMSSQAPTLGQAIGEAGTTGIAALMQAREDRRDREVAAQTRADRLAAAAARASDDEEAYPYRQIDDIINMAESYERRAASIVEENAGMAPIEGDPGYEDYINNLALANTYRDYARQAIGIQ